VGAADGPSRVVSKRGGVSRPITRLGLWSPLLRSEGCKGSARFYLFVDVDCEGGRGENARPLEREMTCAPGKRRGGPLTSGVGQPLGGGEIVGGNAIGCRFLTEQKKHQGFAGVSVTLHDTLI